MDQFEVPVGVRSDDLSRLEIAELVHELVLYYSDVGWWVEPVETGSTLHGRVDFGLRKEFQYVLVQCAHWRTARITPEIVEALVAATADVRASGAILVCSGEFAPEAVAAARRGHVELIDYDHLYAMFGPLHGPPDGQRSDDEIFMRRVGGEHEILGPRLSRGGVPWRWLAAMACAVGLLLALHALRGDDVGIDSSETAISSK